MKVLRMELMHVVEMDHMEVSTHVGVPRKLKSTIYVTMLKNLYGGILFIQLRKFMNNLQRLYGMDQIP
jgi:hypothetical protein